MGSSERRPPVPRNLPGLPPGLVEVVVEILGDSPVPIRRRALLEALERRGRRISLAGLNRVLQQCVESGLVSDGPDGLRCRGSVE